MANDIDNRLARRNTAREQRAQHSFYVEKLYEVAYATPVPVATIAEEFMYAVGAIYEGTAPEDLEFHEINRSEFLAAINRA